MLALMIPISSLLSGIALLLLGNGLLNTVLTLRGAAEGYSTGMLGLIMSAYFVGFLLGTWLATPLVRRVGHIRAFACFAAMAAISALLHVLLINPWVWVALRMLYGLALVGLYMVIESWLNAQVSNDQRGKVFAIYMAVNLGALAAAQQLLNLASPREFFLFAIAGILIISALIPITLTRQAQPNLPNEHHSNLRQLFKIAPLALAGAGLSGLTLGAFWGMAPVYARLQGLDTAQIGMLMSSAILGGALLQLPIGRYSDRHDRRRVMLWVVILAALSALLMSLLPPGNLLLGVFFVWGGLSFAIYPLAVAQLIDQLHADEVLAGSSGLLLVNGVGSICAPLLAGQLMQHFSPQALPLYFAATLSLLAAYTLYRLQHVCDLVSEPAAQFMPMLRTSHAVLELMPDAPANHADDSTTTPAQDDSPLEEQPPIRTER